MDKFSQQNLTFQKSDGINKLLNKISRTFQDLIKKSSTFQGLKQIQGLFKTATKIQDLFKIVRTMPLGNPIRLNARRIEMPSHGVAA